MCGFSLTPILFCVEFRSRLPYANRAVSDPPPFNRRVLLAAIALGLFGVVLGAMVTGDLFASQAGREIHARAQSAAALRVAALQSELEKYRTLPLVLAQDPEVRRVLEDNFEVAINSLNRRLETLVSDTRATVVYVVDSDGVTIAASNWRETTSFIGQNYSFRPYFSEALRTGGAELFALGTVSGEPGLYLARRVQAGGARGVVVVKVQFDGIESEWAGSSERIFVTDERGVVLITNIAEWRFRTLVPIPEQERAPLRQSLQYGAQATLEPLPMTIEDGQSEDGAFEIVTLPAAADGWRLHYLMPAAGEVSRAKTNGRAIGALAMALLWGAGLALVVARQSAQRRLQRQAAARRTLETRVAERTSELASANAQLVREIDERHRAEANLQLMQDELVQANKLAVLGQISAGVAHEINQPLTAIRTYIDNANTLLARGEALAAGDNLGKVADLTDRIGAITQELRAFSRKSTRARTQLRVSDAIDGALLLMSARTRAVNATVHRSISDLDPIVIADRVRLEQVIVNLLQNALDAIANTPNPRIDISVAADAEGKHAILTIADNGPGVPAEIAHALFTPFVTTKPQGLGLGLLISRDICVEFGGALVLARTSTGGAAFQVQLPLVHA